MKTIIDCPTCRKKLRAPADKRIHFNCVSCGTLIHLDHGVIISSRERIILNPSGKERGSSQRTTHQRPPNRSSAPRPSSGARMSKQVKWGIAGLAIVFFSALVYRFSQLEHRYYAEIVRTEDSHMITYYLGGYPNGQYRPQVMRLRDSIAFEKAYLEQQNSCDLASCDCSELGELAGPELAYEPAIVSAAYEDCLWRNVGYRNSFLAVNDYLEAFPQGRYLDSVSTIKDQLWSGLRYQYAQRTSGQQISARASKFFQQLLDIGQASGRSQIKVNFAYELALKDWTDYPAEAHNILDQMTEINNSLEEAKFPLPSSNPPPSIRDYFRTSNSNLQQVIVNALQSRFDSVFVPNPFRLLNMEAATDTLKVPAITIDYKIETLADQMGEIDVPTLYVQQRTLGYENVSNESEAALRQLIARSQNGEDVTAELQALQKEIMAEELKKNPHGMFQGYLLATRINWNMTFHLPDSDASFTYQTLSQPNSSFSNIQSNQDAYRRMMESTFVNYAIQLAEGFGL